MGAGKDRYPEIQNTIKMANVAGNPGLTASGNVWRCAMSLREAYVGVRIIETNDNYSRADAPLNVAPGASHRKCSKSFDGDEYLWMDILRDPTQAWGIDVDFDGVALSEWVARVPGLYWKRASQRLRQMSPAVLEEKTERWTKYSPPSKSGKVMGGIGTFRLLPSDDGTRLITLTASLNASAGVPALVAPAVWEKLQKRGPCEGQLLRGKARWQPMSATWAPRFPSTREIPRGYLMLNEPDSVQLRGETAPTQIHPFTIMEYTAGSMELFDFVYVTIDTGNPAYRGALAEFFDTYKNDRGRFGRYLLAGDMVDALWDAEYDSPADLRRADPSAGSQLALLEARVRERMLGNDTIERLLEALGSTSHSNDDVKRLSKDIGINPSIWFRGGSLAEACSQFMDEVMRKNKLEELVETLAVNYPKVIA